MANAKKRLRKSKAYKAKLARTRAQQDHLDTPEIYLRRVRSKQPKPYVKPLPYYYNETRLLSGKAIRTTEAAISATRFNSDEISNKALSKVYEQLNQVESLRVAWIERQKAIDLATSSIRTLITIARAVKRRDPKIVRAVLKRDPTAKDIVKTPAGLWLSYHFGIVPTISDLHHAGQLMGAPIPPLKVEASSAGTITIDTRPGITDRYREGFFFEANKIVKIGLDVTGINANVQLATSLGLGQPLSVAWELMAFSWLIDYVVNIGEFIKNAEPRFPGLTLNNGYTTTLIKCTVKRGYKKSRFGEWIPQQTWSHTSMRRVLGIPRFALVFNNPLDLKGQQLSYVAAVFLPMLVDIKKK